MGEKSKFHDVDCSQRDAQLTLVPGAVGVVEVLAGVDGGADDALLRHVAPAVVDLEPEACEAN